VECRCENEAKENPVPLMRTGFPKRMGVGNFSTSHRPAAFGEEIECQSGDGEEKD
jgi:hypothetical protein